jgi:hypothetical protein
MWSEIMKNSSLYECASVGGSPSKSQCKHEWTHIILCMYENTELWFPQSSGRFMNERGGSKSPTFWLCSRATVVQFLQDIKEKFKMHSGLTVGMVTILGPQTSAPTHDELGEISSNNTIECF